MLRSLCKVHRWWMSFLPYRVFDAPRMIPPPPSVTERTCLESFNPRLLHLLATALPRLDLMVLRSNRSEKSRGSFFPISLDQEKLTSHKRLTHRGGPCRGTSRRAKKLRASCYGELRSAASLSHRPVLVRHRARRHTERLACVGHRFFVLASRHPSKRLALGVPPKSPRHS